MTNKIKGIPFRAEHFEVLEMRQHEREILNIQELAKAILHGHANTYIIGPDVLCIAGYVQKWEGVLEVYIVPSKHINKYALAFQRLVKETLDRWLIDNHRLQTASISNVDSDRWMESLGFKCEGILEQYTCLRQDYKQWAKVRGR